MLKWPVNEPYFPNFIFPTSMKCYYVGLQHWAKEIFCLIRKYLIIGHKANDINQWAIWL